MKLLASDRLQAFHRVLLWLAKRGGSATLGDACNFLHGNRTDKGIVNVVRAITTRGWAECAEQDDHGKYIWIFDRRISLLPAGFIWADFLTHGTPGMEWSVNDLWARIRALERAIKPFSDRGVELRKSRGPIKEKVSTRFTRGELEMAADVLQPYAEGATMYPWSPASARGRPWLSRTKSQSGESLPTEPAEPSASSS